MGKMGVLESKETSAEIKKIMDSSNMVLVV